MSNPDSFIDEVTEELRRDRMVGYLRRYGWIAALAVFVIVGGAAWNEWSKAQARASAEAFGDAVLAALENDAAHDRIAALSEIATTGAQTGVLQLLKVGELLETDRAAALAALQQASEDSALPDAYRQLAALKRLLVGGAEIDVAERETLLTRLSQPGQPFRPMALEQLALLELDRGNTQAALDILTDLLAQSDVTDGLRRRVTQLIVALGGEIAAG